MPNLKSSPCLGVACRGGALVGGEDHNLINKAYTRQHQSCKGGQTDGRTDRVTYLYLRVNRSRISTSTPKFYH